MIFGYARVSTDDQNLSLQIDALTHYGIDKLFQEKVTGAKKDRPQLEEMINLLREGDSVVIYKLDRISRSTKHLIELSELFEELSVNFISIQDNVDTSTSMGRFFFRVVTFRFILHEFSLLYCKSRLIKYIRRLLCLLRFEFFNCCTYFISYTLKF